jgi:hypothetical protein
MSASDLTLRIEHQDGTTSKLVVPTPVAIEDNQTTLASITIEDALDKVASCEAAVYRDSWLDVLADVDRRNDQLFVVDSSGTDIFGGRLDDWQFSGSMVSVLIDSFERDMLDATPPASTSWTETADEVIAGDIISLVNAPIAAGTVESALGTLDYSAEHISPGSMLRELTGSTGADLRYLPDGTVDYLSRRGTDRSETISPSTGAVIKDPRIRQTLREEVTDVRVVSQSDSTIYEEAEAIQTDADNREVWHVDKIRSTSTSRLQARATRLANEFAAAPKYLEVETTLDPSMLSTTPQVGDRYPVELPAYGLNDTLRVIERDRIIDKAGDVVNVLLSNRSLTLRNR